MYLRRPVPSTESIDSKKKREIKIGRDEFRRVRDKKHYGLNISVYVR